MWSAGGPYCPLRGLNLLDNSLVGLDNPSSFNRKEEPKDGPLGFEDLPGNRCADGCCSGEVWVGMWMLLCRYLYEDGIFLKK